MNAEWMDLAIKAFSLVLSVSAVIYTFFATRRKDVDERLHTGSKRMDLLDQRVASLEQTVIGLPGKDDVHSIELHMERINGTMSRMEAVLEGNQKIMSRLETIVTRHEEHLLEGARR